MSKIVMSAVGELLTPEHHELPYASIVIAESDTGTAYQRFFSDGLFHSSTKTLTLEQLLQRRPVVVYIAPKVEEF